MKSYQEAFYQMDHTTNQTFVKIQKGDVRLRTCSFPLPVKKGSCERIIISVHTMNRVPNCLFFTCPKIPYKKKNNNTEIKLNVEILLMQEETRV